jgi:hypothetical protein
MTMAIDPREAADARHGLATRTIKKLENAIDELLRVGWRGPGRRIDLRESKILELAQVDSITSPMRDVVIDRYLKAGWSIDIQHSVSDPRWWFRSPSNLDLSDEMIY